MNIVLRALAMFPVVLLLTTAPVQTSFALSGPKGFGFKIPPGGLQSANANLDGTGYRLCNDTDTGTGQFTLTLTPGMVDDMWDVINMGGTATIEVTTQHTFTGDGDYSYSEDITIGGPGISGSHSGNAQASSPGKPSLITRKVYEESITANDMGGVVAGGVINVTLSATTQGDLGSMCGLPAGGQAKWVPRGAVLRLVP